MLLAAEPVTASDYRALLVRARRGQLQVTMDNLQFITDAYTRATDGISASVGKLPDGPRQGAAWAQAQFNMLQSVDFELERLSRDYLFLLDYAMLTTAQQAADREAEAGKLVGAPEDRNLLPTLSRTYALSTGQGLTARFGVLAQSAASATANRYYADGLKLSDRLGPLTADTRRAIEGAIVGALGRGTTGAELAKQIHAVMMAQGMETPFYRAMRIARTELRTAYQEAHLRATIDPLTGMLKSHIAGIRFCLSLNHEISDICDIFAAADMDGLGEGLYLPANFPLSHPNCLCYPVSELVDVPNTGGRGKTPDVAGVPVSEISRYARQGDAVAQWHLATRGGGAE